MLSDRVDKAINYLADVILSVVLVVIIYLLTRTMEQIQFEGPNSILASAIFTVIISAIAVLISTIAYKEEIFIAVGLEGEFKTLKRYYTIPLYISVIGLIFTVLASSVSGLEDLPLSGILQYILLFVILYAIFSFFGAVERSVTLMFDASNEVAKKVNDSVDEDD